MKTFLVFILLHGIIAGSQKDFGLQNRRIIANLEYGQLANRTSRCFSTKMNDPLRKNEDNICECDEGLFRHESLQRCVSPPDGICTIRSRDGLPVRTCTEYAMCWSMDPIDPDLQRQDGTCYCESDARSDPHTGLCKLTHGSNRCHSLTSCDVMSLITCRWSTCGCQDQTYQTFNRTSQRCEALVGGTCGVTQPPFPAAECHGPNMRCVNNKCICEDGYAQTYDKKCMQVTQKTYICQGERYTSPPIMYSSRGLAKVQSDAAPGGAGGAAPMESAAVTESTVAESSTKKD